MDYKVAIGIPHQGTISAATALHLWLALAEFPYPTYLIMQEGGYLNEARCQIVKEALRQKATHIMFIDSDLVFEKDGITRLLQDDKDIVGANYNVRRLSPDGQRISTVKFGKDITNLVDLAADKIPKTLAPCFAIATGFMLIRASVFEKLPMPWFEFGYTENGEFLGEDVYFCQKAHENGFDVWFDPTIKMKHEGRYFY